MDPTEAEESIVLESAVRLCSCRSQLELVDVVVSELYRLIGDGSEVSGKIELEKGSMATICKRLRMAYSHDAKDSGELTLALGQIRFTVSASSKRSLLEMANAVDSLRPYIESTYSKLHEIEDLQKRIEQHQAYLRNRPGFFHELPADLTCREKQVVELVRKGYSNSRVAGLLGVSRRTVEKHLEATFEKLNLENRYQLIALDNKK